MTTFIDTQFTSGECKVYNMHGNYIDNEIERILINRLDNDYYTKNEIDLINENKKYYINQEYVKKHLFNKLNT